MNRNLLLIAIAAVAVAGIVAGVLLAGNAQGSLSGAIGTTATTITLNITTCSVADPAGNVSFTLAGALRDTSGKPLAGQTVGLRTAKADNGTVAVAPVTEFATTNQDGGFSFAKSEPATVNYDRDTYYYYGAAYAGNATYAGCSSETVRKLC